MKLPKITYASALCLMMFVATACCDIYDDLSSCPQRIALTFKSQTPCGDKLSLDKLKSMQVQVYDQNGSFVTLFDEKNITVTDTYTLSLPFTTPGTYTFVCWGMQQEGFYAKPADAAMELNPDKIPVTGVLPALFFGASATHTVIDRASSGTKIDTLSINILPYIYNVNIRVKGLPDMPYKLEIADNNARYNHKGEIVPTPVTYVQDAAWSANAYAASFNTLKLVRGGATLIRVKKAGQDKPLLELPLETLLEGIEKANGVTVNLECTHRLDITLEVETFERILVRLNQWNFVYRKVILGQ